MSEANHAPNSRVSGSADMAATLLKLWKRFARFPWGQRLFSAALGRMIPYTGALGARVVLLEPGHARVVLRERRGIRNHLGSVHAAALTNLGELASGLAMMTAAPAGVRGIPVRLTTEFVKKARGLLTAESTATFPVVTQPTEHETTAEIVDESGAIVARVTALWRIAPV
jgi:acyl-coenzyme A thioesterase PaaI-like protein